VRKLLLVILSAVVVSGVVGVTVYAVRFRPAPPPAGQAASPPTSTVTRTDLSVSTTLSGTLGYAPDAALTGRKNGTLTWLPAIGTVVKRGEKLYAVDAEPVVLFLGDTPMYRAVDGTTAPGPDVAEINANLRALGYREAPDGDKVTLGTTSALKRWQSRNGLDETGALALGDVVVLSRAVRIDSLKAQLGAPATGEVLGLTTTGKVVTATVDPAKVDIGLLAPGRKVALSLPNNKQVRGTVSKRDSPGSPGGSDSAGPAGGDHDSGDGQTRVTITIDEQSAVSGVDSGPVAVTLTTSSRRNVLAVPVDALIAVQGGGYAVQVVDGRSTSLVGVRTGMFADGLVEVSGTGLAEGTSIVTAS
jgi:hypothetical protein